MKMNTREVKSIYWFSLSAALLIAGINITYHDYVHDKEVKSRIISLEKENKDLKRENDGLKAAISGKTDSLSACLNAVVGGKSDFMVLEKRSN